MACLTPGGEHPAGWLEGNVPAGWEIVANQGDKNLARWMQADCGTCPLRLWPDHLPLLGAEVDAEGIVARLLFRGAADLTDLAASLGQKGHSLEIMACSPRIEAPASIPRLLDLSGLTARQRDALLCASRLGYFRSGSRASTRALAQAMDCSPATANEHLRKALSRLVAAWSAGEGVAPSQPAADEVATP